MRMRHVNVLRSLPGLMGVLMCLLWGVGPVTRSAHAADVPLASVQAIEGRAELYPESGEEPQVLARGSTIQPWDSVSTLGESKLLLAWGDGLTASLGEFSSILASSEEQQGLVTHNLQVLEGIIRVGANLQGRGRVPRFSVDTALASVQPESYDVPVDFILEVYEPTKAVLTVLSGRVRLVNGKANGWKEQIVTACQSVSIEGGRGDLTVVTLSSEDLERLVSATTIAGTLHADLATCLPTAAHVATPPPTVEYHTSITNLYPYYPDSYVEYGDMWDLYPYTEIRIIRWRRGVCVILVPGIGYYYLSIPVFPGWRFDPDAVLAYCRYAFMERGLYYDRHYLHDLRLRRRELLNLIYLARRSGRIAMLPNLQRRLDYLSIRADWASRRIHRQERRMATLEAQKQMFSARLPRGMDLSRTIADSFNSEKNLNMVRNFRNRMKTGTTVQNRLASMASSEIAQLRSTLAGKKDPATRLALRRELGTIRRNLAAGRVPVPRKDKQLGRLLTTLERTRDPKQHERIQGQLLTKLKGKEQAHMPATVTPANLSALRQQIAEYPNPQTRKVLEKRFTDVERSLSVRKQLQTQREQIDRITDQAAKETDSRKRNELLGRIRELSRPLPGRAPSAAELLRRRQHREQQPRQQQERTGRIDLQRREQHKKAQEILRQKQEAERQKDLRRKQQDEQRIRAEQQRRQQRERSRRLEIQRQEQQKKAQEILRQRQETQRRKALQRKQQDEQRIRGEQQRRQQRERSRRLEIQRQEQQKKTQQLLRQRQETQRRKALQRKQREDRRRQAERKLRQQQEQAKRTEIQRRDRGRQLQQQLRKRQEQERRAAGLKRRQQDEQRRQAERVRRQQVRQQQIRQHQIQQQRSRASQMRKQQKDEIKRKLGQHRLPGR